MITNASATKLSLSMATASSNGIGYTSRDNCRGILSVLERGKNREVYNIGGLDLDENLTLVRRILNLTGKCRA